MWIVQKIKRESLVIQLPDSSLTELNNYNFYSMKEGFFMFGKKKKEGEHRTLQLITDKEMPFGYVEAYIIKYLVRIWLCQNFILEKIRVKNSLKRKTMDLLPMRM